MSPDAPPKGKLAPRPVILLDMDGTLLDLNFDDQVWNHALPRALAARHGRPESEMRREVAATLGAARGTLAWYCLDHWGQVFGVSLHALELELAGLIRIRPGTLEFLEYLRGAGYQTVIATNAHPGSLARKMLHTGLGGYFGHQVSAHRLGVPKEDPAFWVRLGEVVPYTPARAVFVDDNLAVLDSARRAGLRHLFGVRTPSSGGPARALPGYAEIDRLDELIPWLAGAEDALP